MLRSTRPWPILWKVVFESYNVISFEITLSLFSTSPLSRTVPLVDLISRVHLGNMSHSVPCHFRRWLLQRWLVDTRNDRQLSRLRSRRRGLVSNSAENSARDDNCSSSRSDDILHSEERHSAVRHELQVCTRTADRYPNNYHAWSHRLWVVERVACCLKDVSMHKHRM